MHELFVKQSILCSFSLLRLTFMSLFRWNFFQGVPSASLRFLFDGRRLGDSETPKQVTVHTVESCYTEAQGTVKSTSIYPSFDISNSADHVESNFGFGKCACQPIIPSEMSILG